MKDRKLVTEYPEGGVERPTDYYEPSEITDEAMMKQNEEYQKRKLQPVELDDDEKQEIRDRNFISVPLPNAKKEEKKSS